MDKIGVCEPDVAAINTNILIVAVSITSKENSELINERELSIPKHPIIKSITAGNIIKSNCFQIFPIIAFHDSTYQHTFTFCNLAGSTDSGLVFEIHHDLILFKIH